MLDQGQWNNKQHPSHLKNLKTDNNVHLTGTFSVLCINQPSKSWLCHNFFLENVFSFGKPRVSLHFLTRPRYTSIKCDPVEKERLEKGRALTWARSLLPKTTLQPFLLHMALAEREMISRRDFWNCPTASKCVFLWWKNFFFFFFRRKSSLRWNNFLNLVCNNTKGSEW